MTKWTSEQQKAIDLEGTNIIVSAGAGSGKTAILSERVVKKINNGAHINELLILTFTNAAANEMKERIRKKLVESGNIKEANRIDAAYITTFDSYALSIVKKYNYLFNISKNIQIIDTNLLKLKKEQLLNDIFENLYKAKNNNFLKLIDDFCTKDDNDIKKGILSISDKLDLKYDKEEYLKNYVKEYYSKIDSLIEEYEQLLKDKIKEIKMEIKNLEVITSNEYILEINDVFEELFIATTYDEIKQVKNIKLPRLSRGSNEESKKVKNNIDKILKELKKLTKYNNENEMREYLLLTKDYAEIICEIILEFTHDIDKYKLKINCFEFTDISKMAIKVLKDNPEIIEELKHNYKEILLDEYQDTNDLQEEFISLIANDNVYMVGDIKQSIYRFRNANPYIFKEKYDNYSKGKGGLKIDLKKNFRSRNEVLNNINSLFNSVMDDDIGSANYKVDHQMIFGNKAYENDEIKNQNNNFEILKYNLDENKRYSKAEIEIFIIANDIKNKINMKYQIFDKEELVKRDISYSDFVILMDRANNFSLYKKIFEYLGIPLTIYHDENINNKYDIGIIKNIINLLLKEKEGIIDEEYKYYFVSIARSYLFNLSDEEIFEIFVNNSYKDTIIISKINNIIDKFDELSLKKILELIIEQFDFYQQLITVGDIDNSIIGLEYLLNLSSDLGNQGYDIYTFSEYLNNITKKNYNITYTLDKNVGNSVKIMTIHGSKGLEFPICYYSGLYAPFNISDIKERFVFDNKYGIILPVFKEGIDSTIVLQLLKNKYLKDEISEKIRLFYVSLTRAKEKIILVLPNSENTNTYINLVPKEIRLKYKSFADILYSLDNIIVPFVKLVNINDLKMTKDYNLIKKLNYKKNIGTTDKKFKTQEINVKFNVQKEETFSKVTSTLHTKSEYKNIKDGNNIHRELEYKKIEDNEVLNTFFKDEKPIKVYRELEFMDEIEGIIYHGIIDLMIEYENCIKIIDYKLKDINDAAYLKQLNGYKKYIEKLTNKTVEIYLYSIALKKICELS